MLLQVRREGEIFKGYTAINKLLLLVAVLFPEIPLIYGWFDFKIPPTYFHFSNPGSFSDHSLFPVALLITTIATFISGVFAFMLGILLDAFTPLSYIMLTTLQDEHCYPNFTNREP